MENYTKGQWKNCNSHIFAETQTKDGMHNICQLNVKRSEYQANAKLIAAAPEMLNTLFRVHNQIVSDWIPQTDEQKEILESVKNAIKKTGALG